VLQSEFASHPQFCAFLRIRNANQKIKDSKNQALKIKFIFFSIEIKTYFGPIIKKMLSRTDAVEECRKDGAAVAFINNDDELENY
jgi:hypothetical protein